MEWPDFWIQIRVCPAAATVELNDVGETRHAAIVHVGCCSSDLPQRRRLERPAMALPSCDSGPAGVREPSISQCDARVVKSLVAQKRACVTPCAACASAEKIQATALQCAERSWSPLWNRSNALLPDNRERTNVASACEFGPRLPAHFEIRRCAPARNTDNEQGSAQVSAKAPNPDGARHQPNSGPHVRFSTPKNGGAVA